MRDLPELRVLFPTNFSDACLRAGRAIAQLAERCLLQITIVHVMKPGGKVRRAQSELLSFLAETDDYCHNERMLLESGDPVAAVTELCRQGHVDLVMAPSSGRQGVQGLLGRSFRAQLLGQCAVPLWTAGGQVSAATLGHPLRTVACLVDFDDAPAGFLRLAAAFAERFQARLRVLSVVPSIDDGTLGSVLTSDAPLLPEHAVTRIQDMLAGQAGLDIDIAVGSRAHGLRRLLTRGPADLLFVGPRRASGGSWLPGFARDLDRLRCPVVCIDGAAARFPGWSFQAHADRRAVLASPRLAVAGQS